MLSFFHSFPGQTEASPRVGGIALFKPLDRLDTAFPQCKVGWSYCNDSFTHLLSQLGVEPAMAELVTEHFIYY